MLYRKPHFSIVAIARAVGVRIAAAMSAIHRTGADTAYLDGLRPEQLRDLGIRRIESGDVRYYR